MKKIGIITFHNSYNCGSMLESYAIQQILERICGNTEIIDFSNKGQRELYAVFGKNNNIKNVVKNLLIFPYQKKIKFNNEKYEEFKNKYFKLSKKSYSENSELNDEEYSTVVAGSDQIWNITIQDGDDAYFLPWAKNARRVAYAPSFGARNIKKYTTNYNKYANMISSFDALSVREKNGQRWIKELCGKDCEILVDPTLLLSANDYDNILDKSYNPENYIFFYSPSFNIKICEYVRKIAEKYNLKVITWSSKSYYYKRIKRFGFELVPYETPSLYLNLIKNAKLVITTSFHGTIFSTIYKKNFIVVKNGDMYGNDDRVITLLNQLKMESRLLPFEFSENYNYLEDIDYSEYNRILPKLQEKAIRYINENILNQERINK